MNALFEATVEAVEESIYNSLTMSPTVSGINGFVAEGFDIEKFGDIVKLK